MTVEISEIGIRMVVGEPTPAQPAHAGHHAGGAGGAPLTPAQQEALVQQCVHRVLDALRTLEAR